MNDFVFVCLEKHGDSNILIYVPIGSNYFHINKMFAFVSIFLPRFECLNLMIALLTVTRTVLAVYMAKDVFLNAIVYFNVNLSVNVSFEDE